VRAKEAEARLSAFVDFTFNLGAGRLQTSTLCRRIRGAGSRQKRNSRGGSTVVKKACCCAVEQIYEFDYAPIAV